MTILSCETALRVSATCSESFDDSPDMGSSKSRISAADPRSSPRFSLPRSPPLILLSPAEPTFLCARGWSASSPSIPSTRFDCSLFVRCGRRMEQACLRCSRTVRLELSASSCGM